jgi:hypothetical protein
MRVVERFAPLIERAPGSCRLMDSAIVTALFGLYRAHPERDDLLRLLLQCCVDAALARQAIGQFPARGLLADRLRPGLHHAADSGRWPLRPLAILRDSHPQVVEEARRCVDTEWASAPPTLPTPHYGLTLLGRQHLRWCCQNVTEIQSRSASGMLPLRCLVWNRMRAAEGVAALVRELSPNIRAQLFEQMLRLLDPATELSQLDQQALSTLRPLSSAWLDIASGEVPAAALRTIGLKSSSGRPCRSFGSRAPPCRRCALPGRGARCAHFSGSTPL